MTLREIGFKNPENSERKRKGFVRRLLLIDNQIAKLSQ